MKRFVLLTILAMNGIVLFGEPAQNSRTHKIPTFADSAKRAEVDPARIPRLIDLHKMKSEPAKDPDNLLPNRLYKRWEPGIIKKDGTKGSYCFDLTDEKGKFYHIPRCLSSNPPSTIPGKWAGGDDEHWFTFRGKTADMKSWEEFEVGKNPPTGYYYMDYVDKSRAQGEEPHSQPADFEE